MPLKPSDVLDAIRKITADLIEVDQARIVPTARWEDFGADRYDLFGILNGIQTHYRIKIPDDAAFEMATVGDLIAFVQAARQ